MRKLLVAGGLLVALAVVLLIVVVARFDSETLGRLVLERVNASGTVTVEASSFRLHPFRGLEIENATAHGRLAAGRFSASVERVELRHEILGLLSGVLLVREMTFHQPRIEVVSAADPAPGEGAASRAARTDEAVDEEGSGGLALTISHVRAVDCTVLASTEGAETSDFEMHGCHLELDGLHLDPAAPSPITAVSAIGDVTAERVVLSGLEGRRASGRIALGGGLASIAELAFETDNGDLVVEELVMDLTTDPPPYELRLSGDLNLNDLLAHTGDGGFGPGALEFEGLGTSSEAGSLEGRGVLHLAAGDVPPAPLPLGIDTLLQQRLLARVPYEAVDVHFRIARDRIEVDSFELVGPGVKLGAAGMVDLAGALTLQLRVRAPRAGMAIDEIPKELLDGLEGEDGWVTVPIRVAGSFERPGVAVDREALEQMAKARVRREVESEVQKLGTKLLNKLFDQGDDG